MSTKVFNSLYDAMKYCKDYSDLHQVETGIFKPFNQDYYEIAYGSKAVTDAVNTENFVQSYGHEDCMFWPGRRQS